ncbi:DUF4132 domain-containing protein [Saccharophagus degradans]|uniref:DUF4132 domain-containing protein n=1 Tax=Saccharophagus degradans (strain 2-40 / ATCC 43961 / DSM 17024) TaxID=203122 RepID=Q21K81_SACD2|nr:DUF4132 domain-containing protein [Saccharophagus degradans]ABD80898.1 hypothetical protein Sde_1638 [Saccharophagus degradans 2-40]
MSSAYYGEIDIEKKERIATFEQWVLKCFDDYAEAQDYSPGHLRKLSAIAHKQKLDGAIATELDGFFNNPFGAEFEKYVADFYFYPLAVQSIPNPNHKRSVEWNFKSSIVSSVCNIVLARLGKDYAFEQALARLEFQLSNPESDVELAVPNWKLAEIEQELDGLSTEQTQQEISRKEYFSDDYDRPFLKPEPEKTAILAFSLAQNKEQAEKVLALLFSPVSVRYSIYTPHVSREFQSRYPEKLSPAQYLGVDALAALHIFERLKEFNLDSRENTVRLLELESLGGGLLFNTILTDRYPEYQKFRCLALDWLYEKTQLPAEEALLRLARYATQNYPDVRLTGGRFLVAAGRLMEANKEFNTVSEEDLNNTCRFLCSISDLDPNETRAEVINSLQAIDPAAVGQLLDYTQRYCDIILMSLGLEEAIPFYNWIEKHTRSPVNTPIDVHDARKVIALAGKPGQDLLKVLAASERYERSVKRLEAVQGVTDKNLKALLSRFSQEHIRLYGLLPIDNAEDLAERYRYFKRAGKEASKKFGRERTENVREAAKAGLQNLVLNAGFQDLVEMELVVEARTGDQLQMELAIENYEFSIVIEQHQPVMNISKGGKSLKGIPRSLKKNEALQSMLATFDQLKEQSKRYRTSMENLMIRGGKLSPQQLQAAVELPVAKSILGSLVFRTSGEVVGIPDDDFKSLLTLDGQLIAITEPVQIAHPIELFDDGTLSDWQDTIVARAICQPFKQVLREYYLMTPEEHKEVDHSNRYLGRNVNTRAFAAVLTTRDWRVDGELGECEAIKSVTPDIVGTLALPDVENYLTEDESTCLGTISFEKNSTTLDLAKVPRVAFSEFMRDLNLVITAGSGEN